MQLEQEWYDALDRLGEIQDRQKKIKARQEEVENEALYLVTSLARVATSAF